MTDHSFHELAGRKKRGEMRQTFQKAFCSSLSFVVVGLTLACFMTPIGALAKQAAFSENYSREVMLQGQAASYGAPSEQLQKQFGFSAVMDRDENLVISDVRKGTAAATCGLTKGDRILDCQIDGSALDISIARDGKFFKARLRAAQPNPVFFTQQPKLDDTVKKPFTLNAEQKVMRDNQLVPEKATVEIAAKSAAIDAKRFSLGIDKNAKLLADYNLQLIVDRSNSMHTTDCPNGLSRWAWCGLQAEQLSTSLAPYTPNGLTIVPFATEYDVFEHATPQHINQLFAGLNLQHGTRLFEPLTERLDDYFAHRKPGAKPLLIVIVTDGVPVPRFEPALVKNTLIEASRKMKSANDVTVIFCQIGGADRFGLRFLTDLEENLVESGARYGFVHMIPFDRMQQVGLGPALVASIRQFAPIQPPTMIPSKRLKL